MELEQVKNDMFKKSKKGDKFLTRDHHVAEYKGIEVEGIHLAEIEGSTYYFLDNGHIFDPFGYNPPEHDYDLISKYDA